jgi:hypothetical protein
MEKWLLALVLAVAVAVGMATGSVRAQGVEVTAQDVANNFPDEIVFRVSASSAVDIEKVTIRYQILPDGVPAYGVPQFEPGRLVQVDFHLDTNDGQIYIAPGAEIRYHWEIEDAAGNELSTEPATFVYQDTRYDWESASEGNVSVHWYGGGDAQSYLRVAADTLDRMSALLGAQVDFPVKVWVYDDNGDMLAALPRRSQGQEIEKRTAGVRVASDTVLMLADGGGDILRHELTHVVTKVAGEGPYGDLPAWLDEGTAMYGQSEPGEGFTSALEGAIKRDRLLSVRSMTSPTGDPDKVTLFYGEAWSLVSFLVEEYGEAKFAQLYAVFKEGSTTDNALQQVYGFDQEGFEDIWRVSLGLEPRQRATVTPSPTPTPGQPSLTATPAQHNGSQAENGDDDVPWATAAALGVAGFAFVAVSLGGGMFLARRLRRR